MVLRDYYDQFYVTKFNNSDKMGKWVGILKWKRVVQDKTKSEDSYTR